LRTIIRLTAVNLKDFEPEHLKRFYCWQVYSKRFIDSANYRSNQLAATEVAGDVGRRPRPPATYGHSNLRQHGRSRAP
jgi:hypothetical protein